ncbi:MAG TPA: DUF4432 family protein [Anaerolineales bacterium]
MIEQKTVHGHAALSLENDHLRVVVLPEKGGDIFEFAYKKTPASASVQCLMRTPWGLHPPGEGAPRDFLDNYEGGWQELFPNANDGCQYHGVDIPFHGEVALERWEYKIPPSPPGEALLYLRVDCRKTPFRLERAMRLRPGESRLIVREKVTNVGSAPCDFVWGHHITLGGDLLEEGCQLDIPAHTWYTPEVLYEPLTARLQPGRSGEWPFAPSRDGTAIDLRHIPGPHCRSHDDVILGGLERGFYRVRNPRLNLAFSLEWDSSVFPWLMLWQPYGGADLPPLTGIYGIGLEPWVSRYPLAKAVEAGQARRLEAGESLETELIAAVEPAFS